jgi:putative salt-induced outer membrane protein YdiY
LASRTLASDRRRLAKRLIEPPCFRLLWAKSFSGNRRFKLALAGLVFNAPQEMRVKQIFAGLLLLWGVAVRPCGAQTRTVTVTNFVTITITNFVTVTNYAVGTPVPTNTALKAAAAPAIVPPVKPHWANTLTAGATITRGNSDSLLATAKLECNKKTPNDEYNLEADGTYGSANGIANSELYHGTAQWNHLFSPKWYGYLRGEGLHDGIAEVKYRFTITSGVGYYLLKETNSSFKLETGPGIVIERLGEVDTTYATMRLAERFEHKFNHNSARFWENVEFLPQVDVPGDYLINSEIGVSSSIYKDLDLQVYLDDNFNSQPAVGLRRNDAKLVSGVTYKF